MRFRSALAYREAAIGFARPRAANPYRRGIRYKVPIPLTRGAQSAARETYRAYAEPALDGPRASALIKYHRRAVAEGLPRSGGRAEHPLLRRRAAGARADQRVTTPALPVRSNAVDAAPETINDSEATTARSRPSPIMPAIIAYVCVGFVFCIVSCFKVFGHRRRRKFSKKQLERRGIGVMAARKPK